MRPAPPAPAFDPEHRTLRQQVADARAWLRLFASRSTRRRDSYAIKTAVQRWRGRYISGAAVAEAARLEGFRVSEPTDRAGNCWLSLTVRKTPRVPVVP